jgi:hypothetical protein
MGKENELNINKLASDNLFDLERRRPLYFDKA